MNRRQAPNSNFNSNRISRQMSSRDSDTIVGSSTLGGMLSFAWSKTLFAKLSKKYNFEQKRRKRPEFSILIIVAMLIALGTLTLYAIGPAVLKRTGGGLNKQTFFLLIGLVGMLAAYKLPKPELLIKYAPYILGIGIVLCLLILIPGIGKIVYGGRRWINLGPFGSMQPSELIKAGVVFFLSGIAVYFKDSSKSRSVQVTYLAAFAGVIATFILILQRDLGTMLVISTIMLFILVSSGVDKRVIGRLMFLGLIGLSLSILMFGYRRERLLSYLGRGGDQEVSQVESPAEYHLRQSLIAIGSGGIYGRGVGKSVQSFGYLPEAPSDSIFAVYAEKFGLIGSLILLTLFGALIKRMLSVMDGLDGYWKTVVAGVTGWVAGNFMVNMGSILGLIPFTGVPLPFFSLGGTNLVIMLTMIGIVLNLSAYKRSQMMQSPNING
jgi:cell division protein FtsW